jgi:hypothetical protein
MRIKWNEYHAEFASDVNYYVPAVRKVAKDAASDHSTPIQIQYRFNYIMPRIQSLIENKVG